MRRLPLLVTLAWSSHALAQTPAIAPVASTSLKPVLVSGSRSERAVEDVPASTDVLTDEALNPASVQDIRDLVKELPNVSVTRQPTRFAAASTPIGRDGNVGFNIRGLEGNRVLLLVDGIRVPQGLTNGSLGGAAFGRDYFDLGLISRVEIVRGANSALYGSDGLAGSVAMYSTEPKDLLQPGQSLGGKAVLGAVADDVSTRLGLSLAGRASDSLQWLTSVQLGRAGALINMGSNDAQNSNRTTPNPQTDRQHAFLGKLVFTPSVSQKHILTLENVRKESEVDVYSGRVATPPAASSVIDLDANSMATRTRLSWDAQFRLDGAFADSLRSTLGLQRSDNEEVAREDRFTSADRVRDTSYQERTTQLTLQAEKTRALSANWSHKLIYGVDFAQAHMTNLVMGVVPAPGESFPLKRFPDTLVRSNAVFVQSELANDQWSFIPALRYDAVALTPSANPLYKGQLAALNSSAFSPKLGLIYRAAPAWSAFANLASGFKAPTPIQLNNFYESAAHGYKTISNANLKPETSTTLELGTKGQWTGLGLEAAVFTGRYKDYIEENVRVSGSDTMADPTVYQSVNHAKVSISGFELKASYALSSSTSVRLAYGQTQGRITSDDTPLNSVNPAKLILGLDQRLGDWSWGAVLTHVAAKTLGDVAVLPAPSGPGPQLTQFLSPAYTTLDLKASWRIRPGVTLNASLNNVFNQKYWEWANVRGLGAGTAGVDAYTAAGRSAAIALVASF